MGSENCLKNAESWLGRTALYCHSVITVVRGCIPVYKRGLSWMRVGKERRQSQQILLIGHTVNIIAVYPAKFNRACLVKIRQQPLIKG